MNTLESPPSPEQELHLAAEALELSGEHELETFLGELFEDAGAAAVLRSPRSGPQLDGILKGIAAATLPGGRSLLSPGPGVPVGAKLGWMIDRLLEIDLAGIGRERAELERARTYAGIANAAARRAAIAPPGTSPRRIVQSAVAGAVAERMPDLYDRVVAGEVGPYGSIPAGRTVIGAGRVFAREQVQKIIAENRRRNGGVVKSDDPNDPSQVLTNPASGWSVDHIVPRSAGGTNAYANARVISHGYNSKLGAKGYGRRPAAVRR